MFLRNTFVLNRIISQVIKENEPFGNQLKPLEINLPPSVTVFEPQIENQTKLGTVEIEKILLSAKINELVSEGPILLVINDHYRSTPSVKILRAIDKIAPDHQIQAVAIASGSHPVPTEEEILKLTNNFHTKWNSELILNDDRSSNFTEIGKTSRGTVVKINSRILDFDRILCINSVEPHFFAGFTGGVKSIIPGFAAKSTIEKNHSWAMDPRTGPTKIEDNPLLDDLWEARSFVSAKLFGIQLINVNDNIFDMICGDLRSAFQDAVKLARRIFAIKSEKKFDIVLSYVIPPLSDSLYQAQKGIENTRQVLSKGGEMILMADLKDGVGNRAFYDTMLKFDNPSQLLSSLSRETYSFGDHKAYKFATLAIENKLSLISELGDTEAKTVFAKAISLQYLEDYLREASNQHKSIAIVLDAGNLVVFHDK